MPPTFLTLDEVLEIHRDQLARYGGSSGLRDMSMLLSALAVPSATFGGEPLHHDLCEMAAAYLYHITCNHPFVDGNKRVGAATALTFLELNGMTTKIPEDALVETVLSVAAGKTGKERITDFLRKHARKA